MPEGERLVMLCAQKKEKQKPANIIIKNNVYNSLICRSESLSLNR
jgi:hypothetical protein